MKSVLQLRVNGEQFVKILTAEGLECHLGYPGSSPLYSTYPVIRERNTFGTSGWPFTNPAARKMWDYPKGLCPVAEKMCQETIVLPWNEGLRSVHVRQIGDAIRKAISAHTK